MESKNALILVLSLYFLHRPIYLQVAEQCEIWLPGAAVKPQATLAQTGCSCRQPDFTERVCVCVCVAEAVKARLREGSLYSLSFYQKE